MTVCGNKVSGVCAVGKCPHFKRCCPVVLDKYGKIKLKTNEEWFTNLSTEEKAEFMGDIPGVSSRECGNYLEHDLEGARHIARDMKAVLAKWSAEKMVYPE